MANVFESFWDWVLSGLRSLFGGGRKAPAVPDQFSTSLFGWLPEFSQTWDFFAAGRDDAYRKQITWWVTREAVAGNSIIFLAFSSNTDDQYKVHLYKSWTDTAWDETKCAAFVTWCEWLYYEQGLHLFVTLREDHSGPHDGWDEYQRRAEKIEALVGHLKPYYVLGLESSEYWDRGDDGKYVDRGEHAEAARRVRLVTDRPIWTHIQWRYESDPWPAGCDGILYEHSWHPDAGDSRTPAQCADELRRVIAAAGGRPVIAAEFNVRTAGQRYLDQRRAMLAVAGCKGVG